MQNKIPLCKPVVNDEIKKAVLNVLDSGVFINGPELKKFEEEFSGFCNTKYGIGVSSGTTALMLSLLACGIKEGDEVITTPHTFISTASSALNIGAKPVFVDIEKDTYNIDASKIKEKITKKTKAILPVHLYGYPANMDEINKIAKENGLVVIEDACQAHGALYKGKKAGSIGDISCFSFYPSKNMTVCGDGGMVVTNDEKLAEKVRLLKDLGRKEKYVHEFLGYNFRLSEIQAAIGRVQLKSLDKWVEKRREIAKKYKESLKNISDISLPIEEKDIKHVYHMFVIGCKNRDKLKEFLFENGIETGIHYPLPLHKQPVFQKLGYNITLPVCEKISKEVLSLPLFIDIKDEEINYITNKIKEFFK